MGAPVRLSSPRGSGGRRESWFSPLPQLPLMIAQDQAIACHCLTRIRRIVVVHCQHERNAARSAATARRAETVAHALTRTKSPSASATGFLFFHAISSIADFNETRSKPMADKLIIFDTTLRDGEQSPGASMNKDEKLRIARQLERLKVDVIEAGFAASSNGDFEAVTCVANAIKGSTICSLSRANDRDISRAAQALKGTNGGRIHTFIATSALHMEKKLRMTPEQVFEQARLAVRFARNLLADVEFSPEEGYRSDVDFLCRVIEAVIGEGASTINVPDTVGYAIPELYGQFIKILRERVPNSDKAIWSVHCHNDLGMAVANSLAGVKIGGARQVECTINGLGERAGNCSLEEVVMAVKTRRDYFGLEVGIDTRQILAASRMVSQTTGFVVQPNKAIVGANAFAHAAGIHQDGILKARGTYEIMQAQD